MNLGTITAYSMGDRGGVLESWAPRRNSVTSSPKRPANRTPSGSPALDIASGTVMAGLPGELNSAVNPMLANTAARLSLELRQDAHGRHHMAG
jgi:hypothetical protein